MGYVAGGLAYSQRLCQGLNCKKKMLSLQT